MAKYAGIVLGRVVCYSMKVRALFALPVGIARRAGLGRRIDAVEELSCHIPLVIARAAAHVAGPRKVNCSLDHRFSIALSSVMGNRH
ncbi:hypothetical protein C5C66_04160 [Rathayibacter toxicus]|uniref:Uncharacterized protein n=1 Tax=Rathayibacter toxicus TaxID=145458 RepID=A0A0C5BRU1_9MICO|nr:hypothetical protein TI83_04355 [Rathayibacter toxicus]ALS56720.1 hypothetical protein APU90_02120 [Rathayibacter toxicus]KKM45842.1 hypothetical protein VT73_05515 [Rathayibacter toxicus]PPG22287.1 hypothetical protein C5D15_04135 [Rathayibacter toxicus]PPG47122.1 hypothetical protein C5D16_04120 [Rathayibacter toxicus]